MPDLRRLRVGLCGLATIHPPPREQRSSVESSGPAVTSVASVKDGVRSAVLEQLAALRVENDHLRTALQTRIIIEQAKGAISARYGVTPDTAFQMMRARARSQRRKIHEYAAEIVANGGRFATEGEDR
jgi:hypothetical protein